MKGSHAPGYWTKERCAKEALKYKCRADFSRFSNGAYNASLKYSLIDEICSHMEVRWQHKWTKENSVKEALKYSSRSEFSKKCNGAYTAALRHGWLDDICSHMKMLWVYKWTESACAEEALKYDTRKDFQNKSDSAYTAALRHGWLDKICSHMKIVGNIYNRCIYSFEFPDKFVYIGLTCDIERRTNQHLNSKKSSVYNHIQETHLLPVRKILHDYNSKNDAPKLEKYFLLKYTNEGWYPLNKAKAGSLGGKYIYWTQERCAKEAAKFKNKSEFILNSCGAYSSALKNGWMDEICSHMILKHKSSNFWTKDRCISKALEFDNLKSFREAYPVVYSIIIKRHWQHESFKHMELVKRWTKEECAIEASKYKTRSEFKYNNINAYTAAIRHKWINDICMHMVQPIRVKRLTEEVCAIEARKYKNKNEFKQNNASAYTTAVKNKWIGNICKHMERPPLKVKWTRERLIEEALKYCTKIEFKTNSYSAYVTALRLKILDEICPHMTNRTHKIKKIY